MPVYSYITQTQAIATVASRLYDPTMQFWSAAELSAYLNEALQTWNALTSYWRGDFIFSAQQGVTWYDLTSAAQMPNTLRPITVLDTAIYALIQYHLLEPLGVNPWTGSAQFSASDLIGSVQRSRDEILSITSCTQTQSTVGAVAGRIQLPDSVIDVRRMAYLPSSISGQPNSVVWPEDTWGEQSFSANYTLNPAGTPFTYLLSTQPPISFDTDRPPAYGGSYELLTVNAGPALSASSPSTLSVPDDWTHVIKWRALASLLSHESNARDPLRAQYCSHRYRMGLAAMALAPALLAMRINNVPLQIDSVRAGDLYDTGWEAAAAGTPTKCYHAGLNLLALATIPDAGAYSLTATVVENAPLPASGNSYIQAGRDDLSAILDYTQHLASFKQGGQEFLSTMLLFDRFMKQATLYNGKLAELGEYTSALLDLSQHEQDMNPVTTPASIQEVTKG